MAEPGVHPQPSLREVLSGRRQFKGSFVSEDARDHMINGALAADVRPFYWKIWLNCDFTSFARASMCSTSTGMNFTSFNPGCPFGGAMSMREEWIALSAIIFCATGEI